MERTFTIGTGEYGLWKLNNMVDRTMHKQSFYKRIHSETHFKKLRKFIINIDRKEGLYKIIVDFRKTMVYTLKKGTTTICVGDKLSIINNCK